MLYKERNFYCGKQAESLIHFYDVLIALLNMQCFLHWLAFFWHCLRPWLLSAVNTFV